MTLTRLLPLTAILLALFVPAFAADIDGKWTSEFDTQIGHQSYTYDFKVEGSTLTGTITNAQRGATDVVDGKVDGDKVSFVEVLSFEGQEIRIEHSGTVSGNEMKLTRKVGDFAEYEIVLKRAS